MNQLKLWQIRSCTMIYDVIIVGGGPAGLSATLYASRNKMKTLLIEKYDLGGQLLQTKEITNYLGSGTTNAWILAENMSEHALSYGAECLFDEVLGYHYDVESNLWVVRVTDKEIKTKTIIIATGTTHNTLDFPEIKNHISYCAVCDAEFQTGKEVAVIGGGDSALEAVSLLKQNGAKHIYLIYRSTISAKPYLAQEADAPNVTKIKANVVDGLSDDKATCKTLVLDNGQSIHVDTIFACIGSKPNNLQEYPSQLYKNGYVIPNYDNKYNVRTGHYDTLNVHYGVFMAGDVVRPTHRQVAMAVADGATVALEAYDFVLKRDAQRVDLGDPLTQARTRKEVENGN